MICSTGKAKNFFDKDWTRQISLKCFYKFDFWCGADFAVQLRCFSMVSPDFP